MDDATRPAGGIDAAEILRQVDLRLGFGCGELYPDPNRRQAIRLLEAAIDNGITYFDTARLYGHGEAEGLLGELMPRHRDRIILASKAGIFPTYNPLSRRLRTKAALVARTLPVLQRLVHEPKPARPTFGAFRIADMRRSVETSLRALKTDHLDLLLLHECSFENATDPEILSFLALLQREGKIRAWGTATSPETTIALAAARPDGIPLFQFRNSAWDRNVDNIRAFTRVPLITHSVLGRRFRELLSALRQDQRLRAVAIGLDVDPDNASALAQRLLAGAIRANPNGIVLFSTTKTKHIRSSAGTKAVSAEQASAAIRLAKMCTGSIDHGDRT